MKFEVEMRVRSRYERAVGTVSRVLNENEICVKWDDMGDEYEDILDPSDIVVYDPEGDKAKAIKIQPKIDEATDALEHAFKLWQEAQNLYGEVFNTEAYMGEDDLVDTSKFEEVFENTGWSVSGGRNLYC